MMINKILIEKTNVLALVATLLVGCVSQIVPFRDHLESWIGNPISEYIEARNLPHTSRDNYKGEENVTKLENGNLLYEFPYRYCPAFFEVNSNGIIISARSENDKKCD